MGHHHFGTMVFVAVSFVFALTTVIEPTKGIAKPFKSDDPNVRVYKGIEDHPNYVRNRWPSDAPGIRVYRGLSSKTPFTPPTLSSRIRDWKSPKIGRDDRRHIATDFPYPHYPRHLYTHKRHFVWGVYSKPTRGPVYDISPYLRGDFTKRTFIKTHPTDFTKHTLIKTQSPPL